MKKVLFPILALILAIGLSLPVVAHTEASPYIVDLIADGGSSATATDVGDVSVWNDGDKLYVNYEITDLDWVITETHLYAGKNVPPTTSPGQFPYDDDDATSTSDTVVTYEIPLADIDSYSMQLNKKGKYTGVMVADGTPGVEPCNDVYIAAHAVVQKCETEPLTLYPELTWQRSSESNVAVHPGYGAQWTKEQGFAIALDSSTTVWDGGTGTGSQYFTGYSTRSDISWASWNCTQPGEPSSTGTDLRRFQATFDIPVGYSVTGGTLGSVNPGYENVIPMNDNIYIFVNEELIFWGGTISIPSLDPTRTHFLGVLRRDTEPQNQPAFPETDGWHMDGAIPAISSSLFVEGANVLDVFAEELWTGGGMHELGLTLEGEQTTCETETAWGNGIDFEQPNWAMYFTYHVQGPTGVAGDGWTDVASDYDWEARARHGGAGGFRAFVDDVFPPVNPLNTGGTVPWLNGGGMWFELIYDDSSHDATFTIYDSSDDSVLGTVTDTGLPGFDGLIGIQGKTSPEAAGSVVVDNVKVNGTPLEGDDGFTAQGTDFVRDLKYLNISGVLPGSFTLTGNLTFAWGANPKDEGPCLSIYVQYNP
jgi:hypothetical protein